MAMQVQGFLQDPPKLGNQYLEDSPLRAILQRLIPPDILASIEPDLIEFGWKVVDECRPYSVNVRAQQPSLRQYNGWGRRIDEIPIGEGWFKLKDFSAREGLIAIPYERKQAEYSRLYQFAKLHMFGPHSAVFSCPLAMTDGAARLCELLDENRTSGASAETQDCYAHMTSRDTDQFWTSGQWMTERPGGSDVGNTETRATRVGLPPDAPANLYLLYGYKYFTSATHSEVAYGLARLEDEQGKVTPGSSGLALFYIKLRDEKKQLNNIKIHRLKDKLGTETLPTAELELVGTPAIMVGAPGKGVATISALFNVTRVWSAVSSLCTMRKGLFVARDYAHRRKAFGKYIKDHPLHVHTLSDMEVMYRGCAQLAFHMAHLQGRVECKTATNADNELLRLLTPIGKLYISKRAVEVVLEAMECLGGAGYMEDATDLPMALRGQIVNTIWEGTTNILSLDLLRALVRHTASFEAYIGYINGVLSHHTLSSVPELKASCADIKHSLDQITRLVALVMKEFPGEPKEAMVVAEWSARQLAYAMSATVIAALLIEHALWASGQPTGGKDDVATVTIWCDRYLKPTKLDRVIQTIQNKEHREELETSRRIGLDVDPVTSQPRGHGDVCPHTGQQRRAAY